MIAPAGQNGLKMFNMITFIKHGRITTVVIKHIVFEKQCLQKMLKKLPELIDSEILLNFDEVKGAMFSIPIKKITKNRRCQNILLNVRTI